MTTVEILLMVFGALIFVASFVIPESKSEISLEDPEASREQIEQLVQEEMRGVKNQVSEIVDETVSYSIEKTERALERLSNEKITAVSEYTETVLTDIHKSHEEVMFLYDMLNQKHENLKETATEVSMTVKEAKAVDEALQFATIPAAEETHRNLQAEKEQAQMEREVLEVLTEEFTPMDIASMERITVPEDMQMLSEMVEVAGEEVTVSEEAKATTAKPKKTAAKKSPAKKQTRKKTTTTMDIPTDISLQFDVDKNDGSNNNERILALHKKGKSNVAIAKELGLGVGEVKLVIDLFKGM